MRRNLRWNLPEMIISSHIMQNLSINREPLIPVTARAQGCGKVANLPNGQTSLIGLRLIGMMSSCGQLKDFACARLMNLKGVLSRFCDIFIKSNSLIESHYAIGMTILLIDISNIRNFTIFITHRYFSFERTI